jgi:hypothetical protein
VIYIKEIIRNINFSLIFFVEQLCCLLQIAIFHYPFNCLGRQVKCSICDTCWIVKHIAGLNSSYRRTPWPESASELYRLSDRLLSAKFVPTFADRGFHVVSVTDPYDPIPGFLDRSRYFFFLVSPQLYSWGWVDPVPEPLLIIKSGSTGNRTRTTGSVARNSDHYHRGGLLSSA